MDFIIQCNMLGNAQLMAVKEAVEHLPHQFVGLIPFSREITSNEPIIGVDHIPYGSTSFVETTCGLGWRGLSFDNDTFNGNAWTGNRNDMLNNSTGLPAEIVLLWLQHKPDISEQVFLRPLHDLKAFSGSLFTVGEAIEFLTGAINCDSSIHSKIKPSTDIQISSPKIILAEWRWFIIGGEVIDGSMYRRNGQPHREHVLTLDSYKVKAQDMANKWLPAACCVMDTCLLDTGELKVVEFNCINGSGFYDHDRKKVMTAWFNYHNR